MKITKSRLRQIIREEISRSKLATRTLSETRADNIKHLNAKIDRQREKIEDAQEQLKLNRGGKSNPFKDNYDARWTRELEDDISYRESEIKRLEAERDHLQTLDRHDPEVLEDEWFDDKKK